MAIEKEVLDQLPAGHGPRDVFGQDGLVDELKKALSERILNAEIDDRLAGESAARHFRPPGLELCAASGTRATSSGLSTTGSLRGSRTVVIPTCASPRPSVTPKKKRRADTAAFMLVAEAPFDLMCS